VDYPKVKRKVIVTKFRFRNFAGDADRVQLALESFALPAGVGAEMISLRHWFADNAVDAPNILTSSKNESPGRAFRRLGWIGLLPQAPWASCFQCLSCYLRWHSF
jgi:hypothetical protein